MLNLKRTDSKDQDFIELVRLLDADLSVRNGDQQAFFTQFNKLDHIKNVVVAYFDNKPMGCGAFKFYSDGVAEVKRMFVRQEFRNQGIAGKILKDLESWAAELNFKFFILETGIVQPEAIGLYTKSGYVIIPNYDQYIGVDCSVCMKKELN